MNELIHEPLASKIRPRSLDHFVGQEHLVGKGMPIRTAIEKKHLFSFVLWGPPGSGKTTLAKIYANTLDAELFELSAVSAGKDDIRNIIEIQSASPKILFLDEIHRFNKSQQDFLLPFVESGELVLIGATTENPSFEIISALLSRCQVFVLQPLSHKDIEKILERTETREEIKFGKESREWLLEFSNGDARKTISLIENAQKLYGKISPEILKDTLQSTIRYDKK